MQFGKLGRYVGLRGRWSLCWVLLAVAPGSLLSGCVEVMSSPAPPPEVITSGLGATRREWEHQHKLDGPFERDYQDRAEGPYERDPKVTRMRGVAYDEGAYKVTYWVDGSQEAAPSSARISRIEFDTPERDTEALKALIREVLPQDAVLNTTYGPYGDTSSFTQVFICPSLEDIYAELAFTRGALVGEEWSWIYVNYSLISPNIEVQTNPWDGIPPDSMPQPLPTFPPAFPAPVPSVYP